MAKRKRKVSRSSEEARQTCGRRYYYNYECEGTGLDTPVQGLKLLIGQGVHSGLERAMKDLMHSQKLAREGKEGTFLVSPTVCAGDGRAEFEKLTVPHKHAWENDAKLLSELEENSLLVFALVYSWVKYELPRFAERFEVLQVEEELETPLSPTVILQSRLDVLVREKATGLVYVINWKTADKKDPEKLMDGFRYNSQMWAEALAAEQFLGEEVQGTICIVLYKGVIRYGNHVTPLLYAYTKNGTIKPSYTSGWQKVRVDQLQGGLVGWLDSLDPEVIHANFITLDPILKVNKVVEERLEGWVYREDQAGYVLENGSEAEKLLHFSARDGYWCNWCPFQEPCYGRATLTEMLESGRLVKRVDHHAKGGDDGAVSEQ